MQDHASDEGSGVGPVRADTPPRRRVFTNRNLRMESIAAIGFDMVFPEPDRLSPSNAVQHWPQTALVAEIKPELEKLPSNDQVLAEAIATAPVVLGFIAYLLSPKTKGGRPLQPADDEVASAAQTEGTVGNEEPAEAGTDEAGEQEATTT